MEIALGLLIIVILWFLSGLRIAQEYQRGLIFRLGRAIGARGPGVFYVLPFLEREVRIDMRVRTVDIEPQETITKDSVSISLTAVLWFQIVDPVKAVIAVQNYQQAVYAVALTTLRNVIGQHVLDEVLRERDRINDMVRIQVDKSTLPWGIDIQMVEMKDVNIPEQMQRVMAQEAEAMREKRARIIKAEAELEAAAKLVEAAGMIATNPYALELRRMQMITEVGADNNTTTIVMMPSEFVTAAGAITALAKQRAAGKE